jgi:F-type H+-transporting ATPase subunit b
MDGRGDETMDLNFATVAIQFINFLIFAVIIGKFLYKPILAMLDERRMQIEKNMEEAAQAKTDAQGLKEEYEAKLHEAGKEAQSIVKNAVSSAESMKEEIIGDARKEAQRQMDKAKEEMHMERQKAEKEIRGQVATLSVALAEKVLKETIDSDSQKKLMNEFIRKVEAGHGA